MSDARRPEALEDENRRPEAAAAGLTLDNRMLKDVPSKKWWGPPPGAGRPAIHNRPTKSRGGGQVESSA